MNAPILDLLRVLGDLGRQVDVRNLGEHEAVLLAGGRLVLMDCAQLHEVRMVWHRVHLAIVMVVDAALVLTARGGICRFRDLWRRRIQLCERFLDSTQNFSHWSTTKNEDKQSTYVPRLSSICTQMTEFFLVDFSRTCAELFRAKDSRIL